MRALVPRCDRLWRERSDLPQARRRTGDRPGGRLIFAGRPRLAAAQPRRRQVPAAMRVPYGLDVAVCMHGRNGIRTLQTLLMTDILFRMEQIVDWSPAQVIRCRSPAKN